MFRKIDYNNFNGRQKENCNYQKMAAKLAEYGFNCLRLTDDYKGADFIACHIDGETFRGSSSRVVWEFTGSTATKASIWPFGIATTTA